MSAVPVATRGIFCDNQPIARATRGFFCNVEDVEDGGGGGVTPAGYQIGYFEQTFRPLVQLEDLELREIEAKPVEQSSQGMRIEADRLRDALAMIEAQMIAMGLEMDKYKIEIATQKGIRASLMQQIELIMLVEARRKEEEEIVALIMAIDE